MKDAKEILFDQMHPSESGGVEITTEGILIAMEEFANEKLAAYIRQKIGKGASNFEIKRMIDMFNEKEPF